MLHTLLPRSTGLLYSLRSLAQSIPDLHLIDVTIAYPGIPPKGYGQSYYTLRSIFLERVPPPAIHMHIRVFDVLKDVPIGHRSATGSQSIPENSPDSHPAEGDPPAEVDPPAEERQTFDLWLRELWREKDVLITRFHETGSFTTGVDAEKVHVYIPVQLRQKREIFTSFCLFLPAAIAYVTTKVIKAFS